MIALVIEKRPSKRSVGPTFCENGCRTKGSGGAGNNPRSASFVAWIIGRPTYLCSSCAKNWPVMWAEALGIPVESEAVAA